MKDGTRKSIPNEDLVLEAATALRAKGISWKLIAKRLDAGVGQEWFKRRLVPGYARMKNQQSYRSKPSIFREPGIEIRVEPRPIRDEDLERIKRSAPRDTRDLTGRILGDPLPGRSALDQKQGASA